jgi:hypothetical protein
VKVRVATYEVLPPDVYDAEITEITEDTSDYGPMAKFRFRLIDLDYGGVSLTAIASSGLRRSMWTRTALMRWISARWSANAAGCESRTRKRMVRHTTGLRTYIHRQHGGRCENQSRPPMMLMMMFAGRPKSSGGS